MIIGLGLPFRGVSDLAIRDGILLSLNRQDRRFGGPGTSGTPRQIDSVVNSPVVAFQCIGGSKRVPDRWLLSFFSDRPDRRGRR